MKPSNQGHLTHKILITMPKISTLRTQEKRLLLKINLKRRRTFLTSLRRCKAKKMPRAAKTMV